MNVKRALCIGFAGESKSGKSYLAANFCNLNGKPSGIHLDFSRIFMQGGFGGKTPTYNLGSDEGEVGEAFPACAKVGLDIENQYKLITKWSDFENAIEFARFYQDTIKIPKMWIVLDDTVGMRWHKVIAVSQEAKHKSVAKDDWKVASSDLKLMISKLSREFNLIMVNQMGDAYISGEKTGERDPVWIPSGSEYLYDGVFYLQIVDKPEGGRKQIANIVSSREMWQCDDSFNPVIEKPTAEGILKSLGIDEGRW